MIIDDETAIQAALGIMRGIETLSNMVGAGYADAVEDELSQLEMSLLNLGNLVRHLHLRRRSAA